MNEKAGYYQTQPTGYKAFIPQNLPSHPALVIGDNLKKLLVLAEQKLAELMVLGFLYLLYQNQKVQEQNEMPDCEDIEGTYESVVPKHPSYGVPNCRCGRLRTTLSILTTLEKR